jgi:hypothetical protein
MTNASVIPTTPASGGGAGTDRGGFTGGGIVTGGLTPSSLGTNRGRGGGIWGTVRGGLIMTNSFRCVAICSRVYRQIKKISCYISLGRWLAMSSANFSFVVAQ